jgi:1-acyl-sn-glycerol-3-phosphate acyltransferase
MMRGADEIGPATWRGVEERERLPFGATGWLRLALRLPGVVLLTLGLLPLWLLLLYADRVTRRHDAFALATLWSRGVLAFCGLGRTVEGRPIRRGILVANHSSWLDIPALHAGFPVYFVAKQEVAGWPFAGFIARVSGTLFIARRRSAAAGQLKVLQARIARGHSLCFFPEGTSSDGRRILPFKPTLFAALEGSDIAVQPVTIRYEAGRNLPPSFHATWGSMPVFTHMAEVLALSSAGRVFVVFHPPFGAGPGLGRKELARRAEDAVRGGFSPDPAP